MLAPVPTPATPTRRVRAVAAAIFLLVAIASLAHAEMRTFTDAQGRTVQAELIDASATTARIRRADGQSFDIPLETLSAADRAFVEAWVLKRTFVFGGLEISAHRVRLESIRTQTRSSRRTDERWCYRVTLRNRSKARLDDLTIDYRVFFIDDMPDADADNLPRQRVSGQARVAALPAGANTEIETSAVALQMTQRRSGRRSSGAKARIEDELAGIWVRVSRGGETLVEFANPTTLPRKEQW